MAQTPLTEPVQRGVVEPRARQLSGPQLAASPANGKSSRGARVRWFNQVEHAKHDGPSASASPTKTPQKTSQENARDGRN